MIQPRRFLAFALLLAALAVASPRDTGSLAAPAPAGGLTTPMAEWGHHIGDDRFLINCQQMVTYRRTLATQSNRIPVEEIGKTSEGRPMVMAVVVACELRVIGWRGEETQRFLDDVIQLSVPVNPDGMDLASDWYMNRGNMSIPVLFNKYAGHDDNRDFYMSALAESTNISRVKCREWYPRSAPPGHPGPDLRGGGPPGVRQRCGRGEEQRT